MGWRPRAAAAGAALLVGIGLVAGEAIVLGARIRDYDEGVYWQSLRALARGEPLFRSVFASQPPVFYYASLPFYWVGHSLTSLRIGVLAFGVIGLGATYIAGRLLAGEVAGLLAVVLVATSPLYFHQAAILQADEPAVAVSMVAVVFALAALRTDGRTRDALAVGAGLALALAAGIKLLGAVTLVPIALVLLGAARDRGRLVTLAIAGGLLGSVMVLLPVLAAPNAAFDDLVSSHLRAGQVVATGLLANVRLLLLNRELPLEALAAVGAVIALFRRVPGRAPLLAWVGVSLAAVILYKPLFPHHLVMLTPPLALVAAIGIAQTFRPLGEGERRTVSIGIAGLVLATAAAGVYINFRDTQVALIPDLHDAEMTAAVRAISRPGEFWISDNPFAVAAADRDIPGPLVDTSGQRTTAGLLTVADLEATRVRYHVRWVLVDSFRLNAVPGVQGWLNAHFQAVERLGGGAVIYQGNPPP
jgi:4-amino-4-deoxy-L-arabinose transferase-like glycosyltransferase